MVELIEVICIGLQNIIYLMLSVDALNFQLNGNGLRCDSWHYGGLAGIQFMMPTDVHYSSLHWKHVISI